MPKSKSKKRKLNQQSNSNSNSTPYSKQNHTLTHEEIWDDSALIRSWNDALAEYEFYHSIHAKGEDVDEVLARFHAEQDTEEAGANADVDADADVEDGEVSAEAEEGEVEDDANDGDDDLPEEWTKEYVLAQFTPVKDDDGLDETINGHGEDDAASRLGMQSSAHDQPQPQIQQPSTGTAPTQNQTIENIKMAYYWAGYYSGLYDGQQQQQQRDTSGGHSDASKPMS